MLVLQIFGQIKLMSSESGSLTLQVEMNADAGTVHCKFDRMHVNYRIPINRSTDHWKYHRPLELLIKELHVTKKMSLLLVEEQREWRRRRAFVNSAKMNGRENASHTKGLADACISQIFLVVERSHGSSVLILYFLLSLRESPFLLAQPFFPLTHTRTARADALVPIAIS